MARGVTAVQNSGLGSACEWSHPSRHDEKSCHINFEIHSQGDLKHLQLLDVRRHRAQC